MTREEIKEYLQGEYAAKSKNSKLTRLYFVNGEVAVMHFYSKDQRPELMKENRWLAATLDSPEQLVEFDGNFIQSLRSGT